VDVDFSQRSLRQLQAIKLFIAQDKPGAANEMVREIYRAARQLETFPEMGRQTTVPTVRRLVVSPYLLFYRIEKDRVVILSVLHGKMREAS
jgi:toxin ParE1/3/4